MPSTLFFLFNHTPTQAQLDDAQRALGVARCVVPPPGIQRLWRHVPPELDGALCLGKGLVGSIFHYRTPSRGAAWDGRTGASFAHFCPPPFSALWILKHGGTFSFFSGNSNFPAHCYRMNGQTPAPLGFTQEFTKVETLCSRPFLFWKCAL